MTEIARLAKVSQSAVSLILNGKADGRISSEKQKRVRDLVEAHSYRPNFAAKGLRKGRIFTIGIIMPAPKNAFAASMISMLQLKLEERGYMALFSFWGGMKTVRKAFDSVVEHNIDGLISWEYDDCMHKEKIPTVFYCQSHAGFDSILIDFTAAIRQALEYLKGIGHLRIGFLGLSDDPRATAFEEEMLRLHLELRPEWKLETIGIQEEGIRGMEILLRMRERPGALVVMNDSIAQGVLFAAHRSGIRIPEDLSVISFDNSVDAAFLLPPLTTFSIPVGVIADALIDRILARIQTPDHPDFSVTIRPELCLRESCCPCSI